MADTDINIGVSLLSIQLLFIIILATRALCMHVHTLATQLYINYT